MFNQLNGTTWSCNEWEYLNDSLINNNTKAFTVSEWHVHIKTPTSTLQEMDTVIYLGKVVKGVKV
jgi:hypothetical protein